MVVNEATLARTRKDKVPVTEAPVPPEAADASKVLRYTPADRPPPDQARSLHHGGGPEKLYVHLDECHNAASLRASEEGSGTREFREASCSLRVRAYHGLLALP